MLVHLNFDTDDRGGILAALAMFNALVGPQPAPSASFDVPPVPLGAPDDIYKSLAETIKSGGTGINPRAVQMAPELGAPYVATGSGGTGGQTPPPLPPATEADAVAAFRAAAARKVPMPDMVALLTAKKAARVTDLNDADRAEFVAAISKLAGAA